ncbi:hypothetical protein DFQ29_004319 [Apophysomyces sp. BC1021]|nr:hypothetical protein DFQ29_004319 [Apophysomyces sp. BC1021]
MSCDIVWLQAMPVIAALYYHQKLEQSHALYCPDDNSQNLPHIRDIARAILNVVDSQSNKKVAVHFMKPLLPKTRDDLLRFLHKSRPRLTVECCVIPSTKFQTSLLSGWSMSLQDDLWKRRCSVPFDMAAFTAFTSDNGRQVKCLDYVEPFCIANDKFIKKALIVHVSKEMCHFTMDQGIVFSEIVQSAMEGWAKAADQLREPSTLIIVANEKTIYGHIPHFAQSSVERQQQLLDAYRKTLWSSLQLLATKCPIYLHLQDYRQHQEQAIEYKLAWLQHRHHLSLSKSVYMTWSEDAHTSQNCPSYASNIRFLRLDSIPTSKRVEIWKNDLLSIIQSKETIDDNIRCLSLEDLKWDIGFKDEYITPLLLPTPMLTREETIDGEAIHSVSISEVNIAKNWGLQLQNLVKEKSRAVEIPADVIQPVEIRERIASRMCQALIEEYIDNRGVFSRSQALLDTMSHLQAYEYGERVIIQAEAKGTATRPYEVRLDIWGSRVNVGKCVGNGMVEMLNISDFVQQSKMEPVHALWE